MKETVFCLFFMLAVAASAQYQIGHSSMNFTDPSRSRTISCELYYPASTAGDDVSCAAGTFPIIVFGHGFVMGYDAYLNFTDMLVPLGYVMVFPTTETGMSPDHEDFGLDLKFLNSEIKSQSASNSSFVLYSHFNGKTAIAGHSMGGGASFLAAAGNSNLTTLINFAAAETDPSAIDAAALVSVPTLVFMGENDGVAPPGENQVLMYNELGSACKYEVSILGGGHCYFANSNTLCSAGEMFTSPQPTITREEQQDVVFDLLIPYLEWQLKDNYAMKTLFEDSLQNSDRISAELSCSGTGIQPTESEWIVLQDDIGGQIQISFPDESMRIVYITDLSGRIVLKASTMSTELHLNANNITAGVYFIRVSDGNQEYSRRLLISH